MYQYNTPFGMNIFTALYTIKGLENKSYKMLSYKLAKRAIYD